MVEERQGMKLLRRLFCTKNLRCHTFLVGEYIVAALFIFSSSISQHHSFGFKTLCSMLGGEENKIGRELKLWWTVGNHIFGVIASVSSHYTVELVHFVPN